MTNTQQDALIKLIASQPGVKIFPFSMGGGITVAIERDNGVSQQKIWLNRKNSVERLKEVLNKTATFIPA